MSDKCSLLTRESGEPLAGSAEQVQCWVMLEFRGAWKSMALEDNDLARPVQDWFGSNIEALRARGVKTRPQFIRQQHSRDKDQLSLFVGFCDPASPRLYEFTATAHEGFSGLDLGALLDDPAAYTDKLVEGDRYFVCTNGQRDACCAIYGMRVYAQLARQCGDAAWQTTHLGGHRFAATLVSLPTGAVYGQLEPMDVNALLDAQGAGELHLPKLRGLSSLDTVSQWADIALRERSGHTRSERYLLQEQGSRDGVERRVFLDSNDNSRHEIFLKPVSEAFEFHASCGEEKPKSRWLYEVLPADKD
jgi:hypothetical protein